MRTSKGLLAPTLPFLLLLLAAPSESASRHREFSKPCGPDVDNFCPDVPWASSFLTVCMDEYRLDLSTECVAVFLEDYSGAEREFYESRPNPESNVLALWAPKNATMVQAYRDGPRDYLIYA